MCLLFMLLKRTYSLEHKNLVFFFKFNTYYLTSWFDNITHHSRQLKSKSLDTSKTSKYDAYLTVLKSFGSHMTCIDFIIRIMKGKSPI